MTYGGGCASWLWNDMCAASDSPPAVGHLRLDWIRQMNQQLASLRELVKQKITYLEDRIRDRHQGLAQHQVRASLLHTDSGKALLCLYDSLGTLLCPTTDEEKKKKRDIIRVVEVMRKHLWGDVAARCLFEAMGVHLAPARFYSDIPTVKEIVSSYEYKDDEPPYLDETIFDQQYMLNFLQELMRYAGEFSPSVDGDPKNPKGFYWNNTAFSGSDAMSYYCMIRHLKPQVILEVGSGYSTLVAAEAVRQNGEGEIICIEPYPMEFVRDIQQVQSIVKEKVENVDLSFFNEVLGDGDILFIDSTHTVKAGSDCLYLYLKVIPHLASRITIHAHDIFLPEPYPMAWRLEKHIYWSEQYLLLALLLDSCTYRVLYGSNYHRLLNHDQLKQLMGEKASVGGGSFWFVRETR